MCDDNFFIEVKVIGYLKATLLEPIMFPSAKMLT